MGLKIEKTVTIAGFWPLDRSGHRFTLGQMEQIVQECRDAGLQSDHVLTFSPGGATTAGMESAAFVLPKIDLSVPAETVARPEIMKAS